MTILFGRRAAEKRIVSWKMVTKSLGTASRQPLAPRGRPWWGEMLLFEGAEETSYCWKQALMWRWCFLLTKEVMNCLTHGRMI